MFENFKHIRALCCQFKYMTFNWRQNQTFKATYTSAVHNWTPKDCVAEDCNIKNSVWGKAPAKFWELCLRILSKLKHFLVYVWLLNVVKIEYLRLLKQYIAEGEGTWVKVLCDWGMQYLGWGLGGSPSKILKLFSNSKHLKALLCQIVDF